MSGAPPGEVVVVGGCYRERCQEPVIDRVAGSGLRCAALLASRGHRTRLVTAVDQATAPEAGAVSAAYQVDLDGVARPGPVVFDYPTPLSSPAITAPGLGSPQLHAAADAVVAFGMLEGGWRVEARQLVLDPQGSTLDETGYRLGCADRVAVVLNEHEARRLTGELDPVRAGRTLLADAAAEVVVVKRGAAGAVVITAADAHPVGAHPTRQVHPIGSGDAFTAGFASAWVAGAAPVDAAVAASRLAAGYCATGHPQVDAAALAALPDPLTPTASPGRVYLAGPFFTLPARWLVTGTRAALASLGGEVFSPLHDVGRGGDEVARPDLDGLGGCDAVLALLDGADAGTLFEVGWATARHLPVVGYTEDPGSHDFTMLRGTGAELHSDWATAVYRALWAAARTVGR